MDTLTKTTLNNKNIEMPRALIYIIVVICVLPFILNLFGLDFGTQGEMVDHAWALGAPRPEVIDATFRSLNVAFTHTLLEWSAFCMAAFVALLAFSHYRLSGNVTTPIIGVAFFMAGCMDAFHTLAANRLIHAVADNTDLIPFTWAVCRLFNALIMIVGVVILILGRREKYAKSGINFIVGFTFLSGIIAYLIIYISATSVHLPQTTFPDAIVTRPYDAVPLVLFLFSSLVIYPMLHKRYPSLFSHALIISALPQVVTQLHMTFGSTALFDNHFNIAHFMKIVAYFVPLMGLILDYIYTQQASQDSEARHRAVVDTMIDGVITIDSQGIIETMNGAAESIFGYKLHELVGHNVKSLMPEPDYSKHDAYLRNYHDSGVRKIIGIGREVIGLRKNGETFPMDLSIGELVISGKRIYSGIVRDITELKKAEQMKNEFVSTVSHELRTPLTSIRGALKLVLAKASDRLSDKGLQMLKIADRNSERLTLLIDDILDMEKIESGKLKFEFQALNMVSLAENALQANENFARQHQVHLRLISKIDNLNVWGDTNRLLQVFVNLISNAVKFSPKDGVVEISLTEREGLIRTSVRDNGPGISEDFRPKIFERFSQADTSDARDKGGTGLGLSISKSIVERHNGYIGFETELGVGTEFYFDLPIWTN